MTTLLQTKPQSQVKTENLIVWAVILQSNEVEEQDGYPIPVDTQTLIVPFWESQKVDRQLVTNWLNPHWLEDYHIAGIEKLYTVGQEAYEF